MGRHLHSASTSETMERNLSKLHTAGALDDEFFLSVSADGKHVATGGYDRSAHVMDVAATWNCKIPCRHPQRSGLEAGEYLEYNKRKQLCSDVCSQKHTLNRV